MKIESLYEIYRQHAVITTDSRDCPEGSIFLALKGESFDGNKFAASALDKGCSYAIVDERNMPTSPTRDIYSWMTALPHSRLSHGIIADNSTYR